MSKHWSEASCQFVIAAAIGKLIITRVDYGGWRSLPTHIRVSITRPTLWRSYRHSANSNAAHSRTPHSETANSNAAHSETAHSNAATSNVARSKIAQSNAASSNAAPLPVCISPSLHHPLALIRDQSKWQIWQRRLPRPR